MPAALAPIMAHDRPDPSDEDFTILDLTDCEPKTEFMSPGFVTRAFAEAEGLDPKVADQLVRNFSMRMPALTIRGDRARLREAAPTVRLIRSVELCSGDTHAALMGMVYGLPRVVLAEFENGAIAEAASEELARMFESWDGRLLLLLDASSKERGMHYEVGHLFTAHQVDLQRPVLWHRGERPAR